MQDLSLILSVLLSIFGIILLVVLIILGIRCLEVLNKFDKLIDDVNEKVDSLDGLFKVIDGTNLVINSFNDRVVGLTKGIISKIFNKKKKEDDCDE